MISRICLTLGAIAVLAGPATAQTSSLMGTVMYPDTVQLSRTAVLEITLEDVTVAAEGGPAVVIATERIARPGQSPVMFSLRFDGTKIVPAGRYAVRARIVDGAATLLMSARPSRVLSQGFGSVANLTLTKFDPADEIADRGAVASRPAVPNAGRDAGAEVPAVPATASASKTKSKPTTPPAAVSKATPSRTPTAAPSATAGVSSPSVAQPAGAPASAVTKVAAGIEARMAATPPAPKPAPTPKPAKALPVVAPKSVPATRSAALAPAPPKPAVSTPVAPRTAPPAPTAAPISGLPATFAGKLPCADCAAIRYELTLSADASYSLKRSFEGAGSRVQHESGSWGYSSDRVILVLKSAGGSWSWFAVLPDNVLRAIDARGDSIGVRGPADLRRTDAPDPGDRPAPANAPVTSAPVTVALSSADWTLTELANKPVRPTSRTHRAIVLVFDEDARTFSGQSGCNDLRGDFSADWRALTLTPRASMSPCRVDQGTERALGRTFKAARTYRITGTTLELFDEKGLSIARFEGKLR